MSYKINKEKTVAKRKLNKFLYFNCLLLLVIIAYILCAYYQNEVQENFSQKITLMKEAQKQFSTNQVNEGTTYYISANGISMTGTDIEQPMSLENANKKTFYGNDRILFKAGDIFYGDIDFNIDISNGKMIYIGSYGER